MFQFPGRLLSVALTQMLAINRGESQKVLRVSVNIPDSVRESFVSRCMSAYQPSSDNVSGRLTQLIADSANDAYDRLVQPVLTRSVRFVLLLMLLLMLLLKVMVKVMVS